MRAKSKTKFHVDRCRSFVHVLAQRAWEGAELTREAWVFFTHYPPLRVRTTFCGHDALPLNRGSNGCGRSRAFHFSVNPAALRTL